jgi:hypothetical protein
LVILSEGRHHQPRFPLLQWPEPRTGAPDKNDEHIWSLVQSEPKVLVAGDHALVANPTSKLHVFQPRRFVDLLPK